MATQSSGKAPKRNKPKGRAPDPRSTPKPRAGRPQRRTEAQGKAPAPRIGQSTGQSTGQRPVTVRPQKSFEAGSKELAPRTAPKRAPGRAITKSAKKSNRLRNFMLWLAAFAMLGGAFAAVVGWSMLNREADPYLSMFQNRVPPTLSKVLDRNGNVIGIFAHQRRTVIPYGDIPRAFQGAIVAAEDADFWGHRGVSSRGFFGAVWRGVKSLGKDRSGFSTLTMQLVRTVTEKRERSILKGAIKRKLMEIVIALRLEKSFNKQQIMEMYANEVNFGGGHYGIEAASQYYFGKFSPELSIEESALLAALVQSPSRSHNRLFSSDPKEREIVRTRRNYVLSRMADEGYFTNEADIELLKERPIRLGRENARDSETAAYVVEEVRKQLEPKYGTELLMEGGLEIYTTIDGQWQQAATDSIQKGLRAVEKRRGFRPATVRYYANPETDKDPSWQRFYEPGDTARGIILGWKNDIATVRMDRTQIEVPSTAFEWAGKQALEALTRGAAPLFAVTETHPDGTPKSLELDQLPEVQGALLAVESRTGEIRAMVGGYDFRRSQFNRATQAVRQVGSTMKAFVYGAALSEGYTPATMVDDTPIKYDLKPGARPSFNRRTGKNDNEYQPRNYERDYWGPMTFWEALAKSRNIPAVKTLEMAGISKAVKFASKCGIDERKIPPFPSLALGATDLTLKDMVRGYATIGSGGYQSPEPFLVKKVVDRNGKVLEENRPAPSVGEPDIDPVTNFQLVQMLQAVTSSGSAAGTPARVGRPVAGKTGTTDEFTDAWFMGFTTRITCGVWVGLDAKMTIYPGANGARTALPIWQSFMGTALRAMPREDFRPPQGLEWIDIDVETGLRAGPGTARMCSLAFRPGTGPNRETDPDILAAIRQAKANARARYFELEERPWGGPALRLNDPTDPNDY